MKTRTKTKTRAKAPKKQVARETSDRVSSAASYLMRGLNEFGARVELIVYVASKHTRTGFRAKRQDVTELVESVCASALNQDQTKGKRGRKEGRR